MYHQLSAVIETRPNRIAISAERGRRLGMAGTVFSGRMGLSRFLPGQAEQSPRPDCLPAGALPVGSGLESGCGFAIKHVIGGFERAAPAKGVEVAVVGGGIVVPVDTADMDVAAGGQPQRQP